MTGLIITSRGRLIQLPSQGKNACRMPLISLLPNYVRIDDYKFASNLLEMRENR